MADPEIVERGCLSGVSRTTWQLGYSEGGTRRVWEGDVRRKAKAIGHFVCKTLIQFKAALYEHKVCTVFNKQNIHENGLIFVLHYLFLSTNIDPPLDQPLVIGGSVMLHIWGK